MAKKMDVVEYVEAKVTKAEMIDMVLFEKEQEVRLRIAKAQEVLGKKKTVIRKSRKSYSKVKEAIEKAAVTFMNKKFKDELKGREKKGFVQTTSHRRHGGKTSNRISVQLGTGTGGTSTLYLDTELCYSIKEGMNCNSSLNYYFNPMAVPAVKKIYDELLKLPVDAQKEQNAVNALNNELSRIASSGREIKTYMTRALLGSTPEGKAMLKMLDSVKGKVLRSALIK